MPSLNNLSHEMLLMIARHLDVPDLARLSRVNQQMYQVLNMEVYKKDAATTKSSLIKSVILGNIIAVAKSIDLKLPIDAKISRSAYVSALQHFASTINNTSFLDERDPGHEIMLNWLRGIPDHDISACDDFVPIGLWYHLADIREATGKSAMEKCFCEGQYHNVRSLSEGYLFGLSATLAVSKPLCLLRTSQNSLPSYNSTYNPNRNLHPKRIDRHIPSRTSLIHLAAEHGHIEVLLELVFSGANLEETCYYRCGCSYMRFWPMNEAGIRIMPNHNFRSLPGHDRAPFWTALHIAICHRQHECAILLVTLGASLVVGHADAAGITAFHTAASTGQLEILKFLHRMYPDYSLDHPDMNSFTPFHYAHVNGHEDTYMWLLREGKVNIDAEISVDLDGTTRRGSLLYHYLFDGWFEKAHDLIELGADWMLCTKATVIFKEDSLDVDDIVERRLFHGHDNHLTALSFCCLPLPTKRHMLTAELAPVPDKILQSFNHPLFLGPRSGENYRMTLMQYLLENGIDGWTRMDDHVVIPPLYLAATFHVTSAVQMLMTAHDRYQITDKMVAVALRMACDHFVLQHQPNQRCRGEEDPDVIRLLMQHDGLDCRARGLRSANALQLLCANPWENKRHVEAARCMVYQGFDPNEDMNMNVIDARTEPHPLGLCSALHYMVCVRLYDAELIKTLFDSGARLASKKVEFLFKQHTMIRSCDFPYGYADLLKLIFYLDHEDTFRDRAMVERLLTCESDVYAKEALIRRQRPEDIEALSQFILMVGCYTGSIFLVHTALQHGADPNDTSCATHDGTSVMTYNSTHIDEDLHPLGRINRKSEEVPVPPLWVAVGRRGNSLRVIALLLAAGADIHHYVEECVPHFQSPLGLAIANNKVIYVRLMLSMSPPLNTIPEALRTSRLYLHAAVRALLRFVTTDIITMLLLAGADPLECNTIACTPFHALLIQLTNLDMEAHVWRASLATDPDGLYRLLKLLWRKELETTHYRAVAIDCVEAIFKDNPGEEPWDSFRRALKSRLLVRVDGGRQQILLRQAMRCVTATNGGEFGLDATSFRAIAGTPWELREIRLLHQILQ